MLLYTIGWYTYLIFYIYMFTDDGHDRSDTGFESRSHLLYFRQNWKRNYDKAHVSTLQETNISPKNGILKMIFLFPRWDMLIPWRVCLKCPKLRHCLRVDVVVFRPMKARSSAVLLRLGSQTVSTRNGRPWWSGHKNHWLRFPLIRPAIKSLFLGEGKFGGG